MNALNCITSPQPIPTLIEIGVVHVLTSAKPAPKDALGRRLGIHAAVKRPKDVTFAGGRPFVVAGDLWTCDEYASFHTNRGQLPLGAIVATATLDACVPIVEHPSDAQGEVCVFLDGGGLTFWSGPDTGDEEADLDDQRPYGDFAPGRWAWLLSDVKSVEERCPACWGTSPVDDECCCYPTCICPPICTTCDGAGRCSPVPAKGSQGVWRWTP